MVYKLNLLAASLAPWEQPLAVCSAKSLKLLSLTSTTSNFLCSPHFADSSNKRFGSEYQTTGQLSYQQIHIKCGLLVHCVSSILNATYIHIYNHIYMYTYIHTFIIHMYVYTMSTAQT